MASDPMLLAAQSQAMAGWLQFVGSVLALIVAIGVPLWLRHRDKKQASELAMIRATSLALALLPEVHNWEGRVRPILDNIKRVNEGNNLHSNYSANLEGVAVVPQAIASRIDELHLLMGMAPPLQKAIIRAAWVDRYIHNFRAAALRIENQGGPALRGVPSEDEIAIFNKWPIAFEDFAGTVIASAALMRIILTARLGYPVEEGRLEFDQPPLDP